MLVVAVEVASVVEKEDWSIRHIAAEVVAEMIGLGIADLENLGNLDYTAVAIESMDYSDDLDQMEPPYQKFMQTPEKLICVIATVAAYLRLLITLAVN